MQHKLIDGYNYRVCHPERSAAQSKDLRLYLSHRARNSRVGEKSSPIEGLATHESWVTRVCPNPRAYLKIFFSAIPPLCLISFLKAFVNFV